MSAYTQKHAFYKLFKLHGSVTWARQVEPEIVSKSINPDEAMRLLTQRVADLRITDRYIFNRDRSLGIVQGTLAFPAIAIPVETKRNFECPPSQLEELIALLPQTSKILAIGWRATEAHFLALLKENLSRSVQMWIVAGPPHPQIQHTHDHFLHAVAPHNRP